MMRTRMLRHAAVAAVAVASTAALAACGSSGGSGGGTGGTTGGSTGGTTGGSPSSAASTAQPGKGKPSFTLGDKNFAEEYLLGDLYQQALQAKGYTVNLKPNLGSSELADTALKSGKIDGIPEYTGVIYTELAHLGDLPKTAAITLKGATKYENARGVSVLNATPFQDKDCVAVLKPFAQQHGLKTIGDLKKLGSFSYGGPQENRTRFQGVVGLKQAYGLTQVQFKPLPIGGQYTAVDEHKLDSLACFTTDGQLASGKYTVLTDTKAIFGFQQVVPIVNTAKLKQMGPAFSQTMNAVSKLLTLKVIIALNKAVQIQKEDPAVVAKAFLKANGLA